MTGAPIKPPFKDGDVVILRELLSNADLPHGLAFVITPAEIDEYRDAQLRRSPDRKTRTLRTWP